jgi:hypothetical protein
LLKAFLKHLPQQDSPYQELQEIRNRLIPFTPINNPLDSLTSIHDDDDPERVQRKFDASFERYRIAVMEHTTTKPQSEVMNDAFNGLDRAIVLFTSQNKLVDNGSEILGKGIHQLVSRTSYLSSVRDNTPHKPISTRFEDIRIGSAHFCSLSAQELFSQEKSERHAIYLTHNETSLRILTYCFDLAAIGFARNDPKDVQMASRNLRNYVENYTIAAVGYHKMKLLETNLPVIEESNFRTYCAQAQTGIKPKPQALLP